MQRAGEKEGGIEEGEGESFCAYLKSCLERDLLLGCGFKQNIRALPSEGEGESKLLYRRTKGIVQESILLQLQGKLQAKQGEERTDGCLNTSCL